jgi:uncharacterized protein (TIGR00255 family)
LNHRFLDIYIKAPVLLNQYEISFRNTLKERFTRGKIDVTILLTEHEHSDFVMNTDFIRKAVSAFRQLQNELSLPGEIDINTITHFRDIFLNTSYTYDISTIQDILAKAIDNLFAMRVQEGKQMAEELHALTDALFSMNQRIKEISANTIPDTKDKLTAKMKMLLGERDIEENRILQEAAIMATKSDISEELVRIESHIKQFREILSKGDTIGRKLDFILQELNREVNTIASKSAEYAVSSAAVEMKTEIEKMREQVQNIQ